MNERLRAMTDDHLGVALATLDIDWPPTPELAPAVMAAARADRRPRLVRLPLSRPTRILLVAAATVLLLAGVAVATRFIIDLGAIVVERTPGPPVTLPSASPPPFGEVITLREARAVLGDDVAFPTRLGRPDRVWADEVFSDAGEVVRITMAWRPRPDLPAVEGTSYGAVLMRFEGDADTAFKDVYEDTGVVEPAPFDGIDGIWTTGRHLLQLLTSEGVVYVRVDGNVLLWRDGRYTMRLETALPKAEATRIAASTSPGTS
jgi:hypothetical protein